MKILVTGSNGFVGKNLITELKNRGYNEIFEFDKDTDIKLLDKYIRECDFVFHLAGVNRPKEESEFQKGNLGLTSDILLRLEDVGNIVPVLITSSIQADLNNPYGKSKKEAEDAVFKYKAKTGASVFVYRLSNLFGKWSRPNYNTVVATFCNNLTKGIDIRIDNPDTLLSLCYIDDVVEEFINALEQKAFINEEFCVVEKVYSVKLGELAELLRSFKSSRNKLSIPDMSDGFTKKLYSTYLSFLEDDDFAYDLKMNEDHRGSFTEFIRTKDRGQVSVNISKPGITKGNHWHHTKNEKFLVVSGCGVIRFRKIGDDKVIEYCVSGEKLQVVDIPTGYTHSIENTGNTDMVTVMWVNEPFNPDKTDTYYLEV